MVGLLPLPCFSTHFLRRVCLESQRTRSYFTPRIQTRFLWPVQDVTAEYIFPPRGVSVMGLGALCRSSSLCSPVGYKLHCFSLLSAFVSHPSFLSMRFRRDSRGSKFSEGVCAESLWVLYVLFRRSREGFCYTPSRTPHTPSHAKGMALRLLPAALTVSLSSMGSFVLSFSWLMQIDISPEVKFN